MIPLTGDLIAILVLLAILMVYGAVLLWRLPWRAKDQTDWYPPTNGGRKQKFH